MPARLLVLFGCFSIGFWPELITAADLKDSEYPGGAYFAVLEQSENGKPNYVLIRQFSEISATQFDVSVEDNVFSFLSASGADQRAVCEMIYADEDSWFGWCDVYDFRFGSYKELIESLPDCKRCNTIYRYYFGSQSTKCGPVFLGVRKSPLDDDVLVVPATLELSFWDSEKVAGLRKALNLIGASGSPRLAFGISRVLGTEVKAVLDEEDLTRETEVPDSVGALMDFEQLNGLTNWLEHAVDRIP